MSWASQLRRCARHRNSLGSESPVLRGIWNQKRLALLQHPLARGGSTRLLDSLEPEPRFEPQAVEVHPTYICVICATKNRSQLHQLIESRVGVAVEDIELRMQVGFPVLKHL